jgi:3-hydroxy acid dehydrogenase / malonic semialdehyde reductase
MEKKIAMITGASAGFGKATAIRFAQHGYDLIITARRTGRLSELENMLNEEFGTKVLSLTMDVCNRKQVEQCISAIPHEMKHIDVLINNAGLASGLSHIQDADVEDWEAMIDTNLKGLLYVSRQIMPLMVERRSGHIINVSSIAGKDVYEKGNIYCATKHAVDSITKAMRIDLLRFGIRVTSVSPGAAETEFSIVRYKGDIQKARSVYNGFEPLNAEDVADIIWFAASRPAHVNISEITVTPTAQANAFYIQKNPE